MALHGLRADGSEFPMEMRLWRTLVASTTFYTASMVDMSRQVQAQAELDRQRDALRQSEKLNAMGGLLASIAHELNNPLAIVMGRAGLLDEKLSESGLPAVELANLRDDLRRIREASERCGRIVRTFLDMARNRPPRRGPVMLEALVRSALDMLQHGLGSHDIELVVELATGLPPAMADGDRLGQVILNLIVNAQQALAATPRPRRLHLSSGSSTHEQWLRVADNGPGVSPELRDRIFEPFFTTKSEGAGTGLGLSTSRALMRELGGELVLEADAGAGAGASFMLTIAAMDHPDDRDDPAGQRPA
jgi:two-component system NtrC family sensor kinase